MPVVHYAGESNAFWKYIGDKCSINICSNRTLLFYDPFNKLWSLLWTELKNDSWKFYHMFNSTTSQFWNVWNLPFSVRKVLKFKTVFNVLLIFCLNIFFHSSSLVSSPLHPNVTLCSTWEYGCQCIENMKHESHPYGANVNTNSCKLAAKYFSCKRKKKKEKEKKKSVYLSDIFHRNKPIFKLDQNVKVW